MYIFTNIFKLNPHHISGSYSTRITSFQFDMNFNYARNEIWEISINASTEEKSKYIADIQMERLHQHDKRRRLQKSFKFEINQQSDFVNQFCKLFIRRYRSTTANASANNNQHAVQEYREKMAELNL